MKIYALNEQDVGVREFKKRPKMILGLRINRSVFVLTSYRARQNKDWYLEFALGRNAVFGDFFQKYEKLMELAEILREKKMKSEKKQKLGTYEISKNQKQSIHFSIFAQSRGIFCYVRNIGW
jgi:hypothetical protein